MNTTILVLEDDPSVMKLQCHLLREYVLIQATSAEQALQLFIEHGRQVDLLIADVTLGRSSGVKVALLLRAEIRTLPVILTSGFPTTGWNTVDFADLARLNSNYLAILQKPFRPEVLLCTVSELVGSAPAAVARTA